MAKKVFFTLCAALGITMMASAQQNYEIGNPKDPNYSYLKDYHALKDYVNTTKYPNFKLGIGTTVPEYLQKGIVYNLTNDNFTETVAGNAMKQASCVSNDGSMNFTNVRNYVNTATAAGLNIYGHTLAWHSQQATGWLNGLIKDRPADELKDGDVTVYTSIATKDLRSAQNVGWHSSETEFGYTLTFDGTNGLKAHTTKKCPNSWDVQYIVMDNIPTERGKNYKVTVTLKGSASGKIHAKLGDWNGGPTTDIPFTTEWKDVEVTYNNTLSNSFLLFQHGDFVGDIYIKQITVARPAKGKTVTENRRCIRIAASQRKNDPWDNQFWIKLGDFPANCSYEFSADVRADKQAKASTQIHTTPGSYVDYMAIGDVQFTTEWKTVRASGRLGKAGSSIAFNLSELADANNYYLDNISLKINGVERVKNGDCEGTDVSSFATKVLQGSVTPSSIVDQFTYVYVPSSKPLSAQEKHDTLVWAMDRWIKGMMEACNGKVHAWDVVNEAISGGGADSEGAYALQHDNGSGDFFWQDHMGDLEYARQAIRLARKYGPKELYLFINDYNLESDWDNNAKLKSLIKWIERWEADGVTHVDGIGSQMHISCYMNDNTQNSKKKAIENMFKLMAATGKLVRVSELDMGMVDASGKDVSTDKMTESMHKRMADLYEWIVKKYLEIVPPAQQWGICCWCPTDSPSNSGWRANTPVGIWTLNTYYRKHVYAGIAKGLGGIPMSIGEINVDDSESNGLANGVIYDLSGRRLNKDFEELPEGLYIINGKKIQKQ